jgi:hypothetical protein
MEQGRFINQEWRQEWRNWGGGEEEDALNLVWDARWRRMNTFLEGWDPPYMHGTFSICAIDRWIVSGAYLMCAMHNPDRARASGAQVGATYYQWRILANMRH